MAISFVQINYELFETLKVLVSQPGHVFQSDYLGLTLVTGRSCCEADTVEMLKWFWYSVSKMESSEYYWTGMKCDVFPNNIEMPKLLPC